MLKGHVIALLFFCLAVASARKTARIRYGEKVSERERKRYYPFMVFFYACRNEWLNCILCSGTVVAPNKVLTASNCLCERKLFFVPTVRTTARVSKLNPDICNGTVIANFTSFDMAILTLTYSVYVKPVKLACDRKRTPPGTQVILIGYGKDEREPGYYKLRSGLRLTRKCPFGLEGVYCVDLPDGGKQTSTGLGDSGGPLLVREGSGYVQIGVSIGDYKEDGVKVLIWTDVQPYCAQIFS